MLIFIAMYRLIHTSSQLDRDNSKEPSLLEMTKTAIRSLERATQHSDKGFFLVGCSFLTYFPSHSCYTRWLRLRCVVVELLKQHDTESSI